MEFTPKEKKYVLAGLLTLQEIMELEYPNIKEPPKVVFIKELINKINK